MKFLYIFLFLAVTNSSLFGQSSTFRRLNKEEFYLCYKNSVNVPKEIPSKLLLLQTDNGFIYRDTIWGDPNNYIFEPVQVGNVKIYLKRKGAAGKIQTIDSVACKVRRMNGLCRFGGKTSGELSKALVCLDLPPRVEIDERGVDAAYPVLGFTISVYRNGVEVFSRKIQDGENALIDRVTSNFFTTLQNNDELVIADVLVRDCDSLQRRFGPLKFTIKEAEKYR